VVTGFVQLHEGAERKGFIGDAMNELIMKMM
jgi:hypothetical protein